MSLRLGTTLISGVATNTVKNSAQLLEARWFDHTVNNQEWLNADTFSWHSGGEDDPYQEAYNHLVADISGKTLQSETIVSITIQFYLASDGHKICLPNQESNLINLYSATGVAWYYIIDTANTRFKLPRSTYNKYSKELPVKGNGISLGVTNGTDNAGVGLLSGDGLMTSFAAYGASVATSGASASYNPPTVGSIIGITTDQTKSGIIASSVSDTNMKLYFYVGEFSQSATEQTAGLNAELFNQKADLDLSNASSNASQTAKETMVDWGNPDYSRSETVSINQVYQKSKDGYLFGETGSIWGNDHFIKILDSSNNTIATYSYRMENNSSERLVPVFIKTSKSEKFKLDVYSSDEPNIRGTLYWCPVKGE